VRVLFWSPVFWPKIGGVEVHASKLLPSLISLGHEYLVVTTRSEPDLPETDQYEGIIIYRFPFWSHTSYTQIDEFMHIRQKVAALKRSFAPDLIHINAVDASNLFHLLTATVDHAPLLVTLHGEWPARHDGVVKRVLGAADWVAGCSRAVLECGRQLCPDIQLRSSVIHNGLEVPALLPQPLPFEAPRLLCLGRLSPEKGFDLAVTGFLKVVQRYPRARLSIAGDGVSRSDLERQVAKLGISRWVEFLGWVEPAEVLPLINSSTIVLMPSRQESLPLVALEAALMARPVVATRVGGLPEVVEHGRSGLVVEAENSGAFGEAVESLLRHPDLAAKMGQNARARAQQMFSWNGHVQAYNRLYESLAAKLTTGDSENSQSPQRE
jgi:glycogen(starch) synthase